MKKPIRLVVGPQAHCGYYGHLHIGWGFCTKPNAANESTIVSQLGYCREGLTAAMYSHMTPGTVNYYVGLDKNRLRLIARIILNERSGPEIKEKQIAKFFKSLSAGVKMINVLEERHGWRLTKLYDTEHAIHRDLVTKMLVGSSKWMKSPHMLSLFCLLIRIATKSVALFAESKVGDFESIGKAMKAYGKPPSKNEWGISDQGYIHTVWPYLDKLMATYSEFFKGTALEDNWVPAKNGSGGRHYNEGIYKLCRGNTSHTLLSRRFSDLKKKVAAGKGE